MKPRHAREGGHPRLYLLIAFIMLTAVLPASAQTYAPTTAGLRQLVATDAAMLPPAYAAKLRKQEADWEKGEGVTCVPIPNRPNFCYPNASMMIQTIQNHIFKMNGYVFDDDEWSASFPLPPNVAKKIGNLAGASTPINLDRIIPVIVSPLNAKAIAFNAAIKGFADFIWWQTGGPPQNDPKSDHYQDVELDYSPNNGALPGIISIEFSLNFYMHGAAHGQGRNEDFNWYIAKNRHVIPADLFKQSSNWQLGVSTAAVAAFSSYPEYGPNQRTPQNMEEEFADPTGWAPLKIGLRIDTGFYDICPYSCGAPSATIPWKSLKTFLNPNGLVAIQR